MEVQGVKIAMVLSFNMVCTNWFIIIGGNWSI